MRAARHGPSSATAAGFGDKPAPRRPKLKKWVPHRSGPMLGFVDVQLASGLIVNGLRLMTGKNGLWIALPATKRVDQAGAPSAASTVSQSTSRSLNSATEQQAIGSTRWSSGLFERLTPMISAVCNERPNYGARLCPASGASVPLRNP